MAYTEEQCANHYRILVETIEFLLKQRKITEDWMETHKRLILTYDETFPYGFDNINQEIDNPEFRKLALTATVMLNNLTQSINHHKTFNIKQYLTFSQTIKRMVDLVNDFHDEFMEGFANMKI